LLYKQPFVERSAWLGGDFCPVGQSGGDGLPVGILLKAHPGLRRASASSAITVAVASTGVLEKQQLESRMVADVILDHGAFLVFPGRPSGRLLAGFLFAIKALFGARETTILVILASACR